MRRILFLALFIFFASLASAQQLFTLDDVHSGTLLVKTTKPGVYASAPSVETDVHLRVRGIILRGEVTQKFHNDESTCVEAVYAFPLPENAAVDRLRMTIGSRVIEGEIKERKEAEKTYETAKSEGKSASLLTQERPNIFTVAIANIGAGDDVVITINYQQTIDYKDGAFRLRFPMTVAPRYSPASVADPDKISPPFVQPGTGKSNRVNLSVDLDSGFSLRDISSAYHAIDKTVISGTRYEVKLSGDVRADRDFELTWTPDLGSEPKSALFTEGNYALIMVMPPRASEGVRLPKEAIFVIDTSGSMAGTSLAEAKTALQMALARLAPGDRFNVIEFHAEPHALFDAPKVASVDVIASAQQWVEALDAESGTEMMPALQLALHDDDSANTSFLRQVIFMTDGQVGNEEELFDYIRSHLGRSRLFTVGIGAAPNSHFMRNASRFGRGTYTYIGDVNEVQSKMTTLFTKLETPALTNVELRFDDPAAEVWPARVPDLYVGEPVIVTARLSKTSGRAIVSGNIGTKSWDDVHSLSVTSEESGVGKLWAREKIESLVDTNADKQKIIDVALEHHLVTQYTSLVAVDKTPASVPQKQCESRAVPVNLPAGWGGTGSLPRTATPAQLFLLCGGILLLLAAAMVLR